MYKVGRDCFVPNESGQALPSRNGGTVIGYPTPNIGQLEFSLSQRGFLSVFFDRCRSILSENFSLRFYDIPFPANGCAFYFRYRSGNIKQLDVIF